MSKWQEIFFSQVLVDESISYGIVQPGSHTESDSVPIIRVNNIKNGYIKTVDVLKVASSIEEKYQRTRLSGGELLITVVGSIGECAIVPPSLEGWNVARAVSVARIKDIFDKRFIKYAFKTEEIKFQMYGNTNDTVQPTLNLSSLKSLKLLIPPLPEQRAIAAVLSSLDDKIDLLHHQNATLEAMAEALFRQWFVVEAREEWETKPLSYFGDVVCGKTPSKKVQKYYGGHIPFIKIPDMHGQTFIFSTGDTLSEDGKKSQANKTLPAKTICVSCIATVGLVSMTTIESQTNQQINSIVPYKDEYRYYLYLQMKSSCDLLHALASGGTATLNLNTGNFSKIEIPNPPEIQLEQFHMQVSSFYDKILANQTQIRTLTTFRDTLLPKLMSGEVRVKH